MVFTIYNIHKIHTLAVFIELIFRVGNTQSISIIFAIDHGHI